MAPPEFGGSEKGRSLISAYRSLAIAASTSGFETLSTVLEKSFSHNTKTAQNVTIDALWLQQLGTTAAEV